MRILFIIFTFYLLLAAASGCVTVDSYGNQIDGRSGVRPREFTLNDFPVQPGWRKEERKVHMVMAGLPENPPDEFLLKNLPEVGDQGSQPSGTAWAAGYLAVSHYFRTRGHKDYRCSPAFLYNQLNNKNRGIEILEALSLVKSVGCPPEELMPYRDRDTTSRPSSKAIEAARPYAINGFGRVEFTDLDQVRAHLLQNSVVIVTIKVSPNFVKLKDELWERPDAFFMGRHTVGVVGYDHMNREFIIQNSAGTGWGKSGLARIKYDWFLRIVAHAYILW